MMLGAIEVEAADIDETPLVGEQAHDLVRRLAREKAAVVAQRHPDRTVLAADTVVVIDGEILGKPTDRRAAGAMLRRLAGRAHQTVTGIAIVSERSTTSASESTDVTFRSMTEAEIDRYLATGEADDKAGAYGIQGRASVFIERIEGSHQNVVGLPLAAVDTLMQSMGLSLLDFEQPTNMVRES